ncbi:MAG: hypothetical protein V4456_02890 [Bacteroidota bacterium]
MKNFKIYASICLVLICAACQNPDKRTTSSSVIDPTEVPADSRPKDQIQFLNKVGDNSNLNMPSSAIAKDGVIAAFNKYAADSLTSIKNWEFQVTAIDDESYHANSVFKSLGNGNEPIYNLILVAPVKIDNSVDTIAIIDRIEFTYTTPKNPKNESLKKVLTTLKSLANGDIVLISGAVTHVNDKGKIDFSSFFDDSLMVWNLDVLITDIRKKPTQK